MPSLLSSVPFPGWHAPSPGAGSEGEWRKQRGPSRGMTYGRSCVLLPPQGGRPRSEPPLHRSEDSPAPSLVPRPKLIFSELSCDVTSQVYV